MHARVRSQPVHALAGESYHVEGCRSSCHSRVCCQEGPVIFVIRFPRLFWMDTRNRLTIVGVTVFHLKYSSPITIPRIRRAQEISIDRMSALAGFKIAKEGLRTPRKKTIMSD